MDSPLRISLGFLLILLLTGCLEKTDCTAEINQKMIEAEAKTHVYVDYMESQASIARGCDTVLSLCPSSITKTGREAIANGYMGNGGWFWLAAFLKLAIIAGMAGAMFASFVQVWVRFTLPSLNDRKTAMQMINTATDQAETARQSAAVAQIAEAEAKKRIASFKNEAVTIENQILASRQRLAEAEILLERTKTMQEAASVFIGL